MKTVRPATRVAWQELGGDVVLVDLVQGKAIGLNRAGSLLWKRVLPGATEEDLVSVLVSEYGLDGQRARADVASFLGSLGERGLLA